MPATQNARAKLLQFFAPLLKQNDNDFDPTQCPQGLDYERLDQFHKRAEADKELKATHSPDPHYVNRLMTILALFENDGYIMRKRGEKNKLSICFGQAGVFKPEGKELDRDVIDRAAKITPDDLARTCGNDKACHEQGKNARAYARAYAAATANKPHMRM